jgi:microsomal dipeptidase-like Zn-dependent dipeptidase
MRNTHHFIAAAVALSISSTDAAAQKKAKPWAPELVAALKKGLLARSKEHAQKVLEARTALFSARAQSAGLVAKGPVQSVATIDPKTRGYFQETSGGWLSLAPNSKQPFLVKGLFLDEWKARGAENGLLGFPIADETQCTNSPGGQFQRFTGGMLYQGPKDRRPIVGGTGKDCPDRKTMKIAKLLSAMADRATVRKLARAGCLKGQAYLLRYFPAYQHGFDRAYPEIAAKSFARSIEQVAALAYLKVAFGLPKGTPRLNNVENKCMLGLVQSNRHRAIETVLAEKFCNVSLGKSQCRLSEALRLCSQQRNVVDDVVRRLSAVLSDHGGVADAKLDAWAFATAAWASARVAGRISSHNTAVSLDNDAGACLRDVAIAKALPAARARLTVLRAREQKLKQEIHGFADLHTHQFGNLATGGLKNWGKPFAGSPTASYEQQLRAALPWCDYYNGVIAHGAGGSNDLPGEAYHYNGGYPEFNGWPHWNSTEHQKMHFEWVRRAYEGGLRLLVMLAVNNEMQCRASNNDRPNHTCADMDTTYEQLQAAKDLEQFIDKQAGGAGKGYYRIVYNPAQARRVIADGKMAVVLGVEVDTVFDCFTPWARTGQGALGMRVNNVYPRRPTCSESDVRDRLRRFYEFGARQITPIHLADNGFGAPAIYHEAFNVNNWFINDGRHYETERCTDSSIDFSFGHLSTGQFLALWTVKGYGAPPVQIRPACHARGLTDLGRKFIGMMMDEGVLIDVDHMSEKSFWDTVQVVEGRGGYPLISSHSGFRELGYSQEEARSLTDDWIGLVRSETMKSPAQLRRIQKLGGMVAPIMLADAVNTANVGSPGGLEGIPNDCDGSSKSWIQNYLYAKNFFPGRGVGLATDHPGLKHPGPRFGRDACPSNKRQYHDGSRFLRQKAAQSRPVKYINALSDCRGYRFYNDAGTEWGTSLIDVDGIALEGICMGLGMVHRDPWRECEEKKPNCGGALGCQRVRNICKGVAGSRLWGGCHLDPDRPLIDVYAGPGVRRGACLGMQSGVNCASLGDWVERDACKDVVRMKGAFVEPQGEFLVRSTAGVRQFDFNVDGLAHYGLLKDFVQDLRNIGVSETQLRPLFRSAEEYIRIWERIERQKGTRRPHAKVPFTGIVVPKIPKAPMQRLPNAGYIGTQPVPTMPLPKPPASGFELGVDRPGNDIQDFDLPSAEPRLCAEACAKHPACQAFTYVKPNEQGPRARCYLKNPVPPRQKGACCVSGLRPR